MSKNINVWICTSAPKEFTKLVYRRGQAFSLFENKTAWREMYINGKPNAEPILHTLNKMNLPKDEAVYVGDAYNDYLSAVGAGCGFIYLCNGESNKDNRIPLDIQTVSSHKDIIAVLKL